MSEGGLLHTSPAHRVLNNVVITTVIEMVEMGEILNGRVGKRSVERVGYVIFTHFITLGHSEILSHFTRTLYFHSPSASDALLKYLVIFHADPCYAPITHEWVITGA